MPKLDPFTRGKARRTADSLGNREDILNCKCACERAGI